MPEVSVILPNYNHSRYLKERIDSILNQTFQDFELIILDDCSTDSSMDVINQFKNNSFVSHIIEAQSNSGSTFIQWEKGIKLAQGKYIWIAESDDLAHPEFLSKHLSIFNQNPEVGLSFSASAWIDENGKIIHEPAYETTFIKTGQELLKTEFSKGTFIYNASSCVFKKNLVPLETLKKISQFKYCGDWLFWAKMVPEVSVSRIGERLNFFRRHNQNVSFGSDHLGLRFTEGLPILKEVQEMAKMNALEKSKNFVYWAMELYLSPAKNKKELIKLYPLVGKITFGLAPIILFFRKLNRA